MALFSMFVAGGCGGGRPIDVRVISIDRTSVVVEVRNASKQDVVFLNPERPDRQVDGEACEAVLSTEVTDFVRPYAFTPTLETVRAGSTRRFRAGLAPLTLSKPCRTWTVNVEYAYILRSDAEELDPRAYEELRRHVLAHQKTVSTSAVAAIKS